MTTAICDICHGRGGPIEIECPNCSGTGYDPTEDNPFGQCHSCYGDGTIDIDECTNCDGTGEVDVED